MSELVTAGLARRGAIALDFARGEARGLALLVNQIGDGLLPRPAQMVQARIDHTAIGAKQHEFQIAEPPKRIIVIHAKLVGQLFGIERPPLAIA